MASNTLLKNVGVRRLLVIALLAEIGYAALNLSTMPIYLDKDRQFGESIIGLVLMGFVLSEAIFKGPMGAFADKFSRKKLMVLGPALTIFTSIATILVPHHWGVSETLLLIFLRVLDGLGAAMLWPAAFALMGDMVEDHERQHAMSLLNLCYLGGIAFAFPVGGLINDYVGPLLANISGPRSASLYLSAVLFMGVAAAGYYLLKEERHTDAKSEHSHDASLKDLLLSLKDIPEYLALAVVTFMGVGFPMTIMKIFAEDQFKMSESAFGLLVLPAVIAMGVFSTPLTRYGERIGRARAVHIGLALCTAGTLLIGSGMFLPFMREIWPIAVGGIGIGFGFLLTIPAWYASVSDIDPRKRGSNLGAVMTAQGIGAIFGLLIGSLIYEKLQPVGKSLGLGVEFGRYAPFMGCAICVGIGFLLSIITLKHRPSAHE